MAKLRRNAQVSASDAASLRLRAAWAYYNQGLTQKEVAERLGLSRTTVTRLLEEARRRGEVQIWIDEGIGECVALAQQLEARFGLDEAVVVPCADDAPDAVAAAVGAALGRFLSEAVQDNMTIGVGWGRTLSAALTGFRPPRREGMKVVSLLGGIVDSRAVNPIDFSWRFAGALGADCYLYPAPLLVDSPETRRRLIDQCGLDQLERLADALDVAVFSVGDVAADGSSLSRALLPEDVVGELVAMGAVCDELCHFLDAEGKDVAHPVHDRIMAVGLDRVAKSGHVVVATGGARRVPALAAALKRMQVHTLVTDETAARALLARG